MSTDGAQIAAIARDAGAEIIDRPAHLASSTATSESALLHALDELEARGIHPQVLVFIQATSPFIDPADLDFAITRILTDRPNCRSGADSPGSSLSMTPQPRRGCPPSTASMTFPSSCRT